VDKAVREPARQRPGVARRKHRMPYSG